MFLLDIFIQHFDFFRKLFSCLHLFLFLSNAILSVGYPIIVDIRAQAIRSNKYHPF